MPAAAVAAPETLVPAPSVTLTDFFKEKGVKLEPQVAHGFKALNLVLPVPRGWSQVPDPNVPDAFAVLADRVGGDGIYTSNAALVVYKLVGGDFDPKEAITHGYIDSQQLPAWRTTNASLADFGGMPSATIEGTYRDNNMTLNTSRRHTISTAGSDKYLVTLSVTTTAAEAVPAANATDAITNGFKIGQCPGAPQLRPRPRCRSGHLGSAADWVRRPLWWPHALRGGGMSVLPPSPPPPSADGRCPAPGPPTWSARFSAQSLRHSSPPRRC